MRQKMFIVEDHFQISGRGLVITSKRENTTSYKAGDLLTIVRPDGSEIKSTLVGIEMLSPPNLKTEAILVSSLTKEDVPIGSKVYTNTD